MISEGTEIYQLRFWLNKITELTEEFFTYIENNQKLIPNYGIKYYYGDIISTSFVESTVNEIVSKRMAKKQQQVFLHKFNSRII